MQRQTKYNITTICSDLPETLDCSIVIFTCFSTHTVVIVTLTVFFPLTACWCLPIRVWLWLWIPTIYVFSLNIQISLIWCQNHNHNNKRMSRYYPLYYSQSSRFPDLFSEIGIQRDTEIWINKAKRGWGCSQLKCECQYESFIVHLMELYNIQVEEIMTPSFWTNTVCNYC